MVVYFGILLLLLSLFHRRQNTTAKQTLSIDHPPAKQLQEGCHFQNRPKIRAAALYAAGGKICTVPF
jgi:hypothetical protein